uniref:Uncharacterized protein n=1 Tax=Anopheles culicifacies TaxID=139723 RepID=A0A182MJD7_9DIPT
MWVGRIGCYLVVGGSVAEETEAPVFKRTGPRFESHSGRSLVRQDCGYIQVTEARNGRPRPLRVVESKKKKKFLWQINLWAELAAGWGLAGQGGFVVQRGPN